MILILRARSCAVSAMIRFYRLDAVEKVEACNQCRCMLTLMTTIL